jgi:acetyl-CoA carboxylase biotin carboxyl carrier protein
MAEDVKAHITGNVWKILKRPGDDVREGDTLMILESMKMEIPVDAEDDGKVTEVFVEEGQAVVEGERLCALEL